MGSSTDPTTVRMRGAAVAALVLLLAVWLTPTTALAQKTDKDKPNTDAPGQTTVPPESSPPGQDKPKNDPPATPPGQDKPKPNPPNPAPGPNPNPNPPGQQPPAPAPAPPPAAPAPAPSAPSTSKPKPKPSGSGSTQPQQQPASAGAVEAPAAQAPQASVAPAGDGNRPEGSSSRPPRESTYSGREPRRSVERASLGFAAIETSRALAFPLGLSLVVAGFLLVQGYLDRRDPKLAVAPLDAKDDLVSFEDASG
jgi:hypothetical protein